MDAVQTWGRDAQALMMIEEMSELTKEVCTVDLKVLKKCAKGEDVKALQHLLIGNGFSVGASGADGSFGAATDTAVRAYQKAKGLSVDGSCGGKTWAKLLGQG